MTRSTRKTRWLALATFATVAGIWLTTGSGCSKETMPTPERATDPEDTAAIEPPPVSPTRFTLKSSAFGQGQPIPVRHTADGSNISPPLAISDQPEAVKELALICEDPDAASSTPWVHWVLYKIPADTKVLPANIPHLAKVPMPAGALQGQTSFDAQLLGYRGPEPPRGKLHHYHFRLFAARRPAECKARARQAATARRDAGTHPVGDGSGRHVSPLIGETNPL